ncbi:hypothetical protein Tco_0859022 [Tanacetum coccineum]|uniref:Uncharacterized protein n=1 Tax=Tanacetum coccineum TaxID=301880 RepID=A0ABQ5BAX9_9ASTR
MVVAVRVYTGRAPYPNGSDGSGRAHYINPKEDKTLGSIKRDTSSNRWTITNTYATSLSRELRSDVSKEYQHPRQRLGIGRLLHSQGVKNSISKQYFKTVHWNNWGDEGHLRSRGKEQPVRSSWSPQEARGNIVSIGASTLTTDIQNPGRANGVLSYFSLRDEGVAAGYPEDQGTFAPAVQAQGGPSAAFMKENIDVLRTMIKELDNRGQEKVTPRKLFNEESGEAGSKNS